MGTQGKGGQLDEIELGNLNDRELLLLTVQQVNNLMKIITLLSHRIDELERWRANVWGVLTVVAFMVPLAVSIIVRIIWG